MTRLKRSTGCALAVFAMAVAGCKDHAQDVQAFDAASVAAEADKGNLVPLKTLIEACRNEVEKYQRRADVCKKLDRVRTLREPLNIRF